MDHEKLADALKGLTRRQLEDVRARIDLELRACTICATEGAAPYRVTGGSKSKATLMLCLPCFEKHRLPEGRLSDT